MQKSTQLGKQIEAFFNKRLEQNAKRRKKNKTK